jgi:hypothetical protein
MERRAVFFAAALVAFAAQPAEAHGKKYFLTVDSFQANEARGACGKGYHMASLWEILDPTDLRYDAKRGQTQSDAGSGPPAGEIGWIRTGSSSNSAGGPGSGNCNSWSSFMAMEFGSTAALSVDWDGAGVAADPWTTSTSSCVAVLPVWCKQN